MMALLWGYSRWLLTREMRPRKPDKRDARLLVWIVKKARPQPEWPHGRRRNRFGVAKRAGRATASPGDRKGEPPTTDA